ncbi:myrosinase 1-like [Phlebotomus argentipes]|uniref:myrosinase 1-like n=1 Tax=Phlebotomus argentipes TaxID=94469 RepID=UPI002892E822|nr:myrosinase 1-like [Phlebotomus argentipes]
MKFWILPLVFSVIKVLGSNTDQGDQGSCSLHKSFPDTFTFGVSTASYQIEGGWNADGKGVNIWDTLTHDHPELIADKSNGDVGPDSYHLYKEDVKRLKELGVNFYRFSVSWSRILPTGDVSSLNPAGVKYYSDLIDLLLQEGIQPMVTMFHYDLPQYLQDMGGLLNPIFVNYFREYARILYMNYGSRVKHWITFNEPSESCILGYGSGALAPVLKLHGVGEYLCAYHVLLAHAEAYHIYHMNYAAKFGGKVGITLDSGWFYQKSPGNDLVERAMAFQLGFFANAIFSRDGGWSKILQEIVDKNSMSEGRVWSRLPPFSPEEVQKVRGTADFLGLNYYTARFLEPANYAEPANPSWERDQNLTYSVDPSWKRAKSTWLYMVPHGLRDILKWIKLAYENPEVIITENGWSDSGELEDDLRVEYLKGHLGAVLEALQAGCRVSGYAHWSLLDNFEWMMGYTEKFGLYRVDNKDPEKKRVAKKSARIYKEIIKTRFCSDNLSSEDGYSN